MLIILAFTVTLTLNTANLSFNVTLQLTIMPQHTKFDNKRFSGSEEIVRAVTDILDLRYDLERKHSTPIFP